MEEIRLTQPMYVVKANKKLNLFLGAAHGFNAVTDKITEVAQNDLKFAFYFKTRAEALAFLNAYLKDKKAIIKPENIKYYEVEPVLVVPYEPNTNIMKYDIACWFSTEAYCAWRRNPEKYKKVL